MNRKELTKTDWRFQNEKILWFPRFKQNNSALQGLKTIIVVISGEVVNNNAKYHVSYKKDLS